MKTETFSGENVVVYTEAKILFCTHETYIVLKTNVTSIKKKK